jgi:hypothetical protein
MSPALAVGPSVRKSQEAVIQLLAFKLRLSLPAGILSPLFLVFSTINLLTEW